MKTSRTLSHSLRLMIPRSGIIVALVKMGKLSVRWVMQFAQGGTASRGCLYFSHSKLKAFHLEKNIAREDHPALVSPIFCIYLL